MVEIYTPRSLSPKRLDNYLAKGWFRSCNSLFKPHVLFLDDTLSDIVNIRLKIEDFSYSKRQKKRMNQIKKNFKIVSRKAKITADKEELYEQHKEKFKGFVFHNLSQVIMDFRDSPLFDTYEICIYDNEKLIAFSFFDLGFSSIASVLSVYDRNYERYSLGVATMFLEIEKAQSIGLAYYYPGYIFDNNPAFDYKLRKTGMQHLDNYTNRWKKFVKPDRSETLSYQIENYIKALQVELESKDITFYDRYYPMNGLGYISHPNNIFLKGVYALYNQVTSDSFLVIEYLPELVKFVVSIAKINNGYRELFELEGHVEDLDPEICMDHILEYEEVLLHTEDMNEVISYMKEIYSDALGN